MMMQAILRILKLKGVLPMPGMDMGGFLNLLVEMHKIPLFKILNEDEKRKIANYCQLVPLAANQVVIRQGETGTDLYILLSGILNVTVKDSDGEDVFLGNINPGEFFGEEGLFIDAQRTANIFTASEAAQLLSINRASFFGFIRTYPAGGVKMMMHFIKNLLKKSAEPPVQIYRANPPLEPAAIDQQMDRLMELM